MHMHARVGHAGHRAAFLAIVPVLLTAACATNPATGKRELALVSQEQEIQMGREAAAQVPETLGLVDNTGLQSYVSRIGKNLAARSERPNLPWEFHVVDDPSPNAFALPGGFIYVTRGMMNLMTNEAQLASVLGHEIGHVTARHSVSQISKQQLAQIGLGLGSVLSPAVGQLQPLIGTGLGLLFLKYGRDDEREADTLGFKYIQSGGYDAAQFDDVFLALERTAVEGASAVPAWLQTHPRPAERASVAEKRAAALPPQEDARVGREPYLRQIDDLVYGKDPRDGFFEDGVFYHPRLQFQIDFPNGWESANLTQAVVAAAPRQQAMLQLTIAGTLAPRAALTRFVEQPGLQIGRTSTANVNGQPAAMGEFAAATEGGTVRGLVAFVSHGDRTYQIVGYTPADRYGAFVDAFNRTIQSFGPVRRAEVLRVQPKRIDIVEVQSAMTLREFAERYRSAAPAAELAVLNQLPNEDARIPAGTLVKRVIESGSDRGRGQGSDQ